MPIRAYCDEIGPVVRGWALDDTDLARKVELIIEINGRSQRRVSCQLKRGDLQEHFGSSDHGFEIDISKELQNGLNSVTIQSSETGELIPFGQGEFTFEDFKQKYLAGKDGWLFLDNDSNSVIKQLQGGRELSESSLVRIRKQLIAREIVSHEFGSKCIQLIVPEKHLIYSEYMPVELSISASRPSEAIKAALRSSDFEVSWHYAPEVMIRAKSRGRLYHKTDTHPTDLGALIMLEDLSRVSGIKLTDRACFVEDPTTSLVGDLGSKISSDLRETTLRYRANFPVERLVDTTAAAYEYDLSRTGSYAILKNQNLRNQGTLLLVFGTSTAYNAVELLTSQFEYTVFCWSNHWDLDVVRELRPNVILNIITERVIPDRFMDTDFEMPGGQDFLQKLRMLASLPQVL